MGPSQSSSRNAYADAHEQASLGGGGDRHVPVDEERKPAEHRHLAQPGLVHQQLADPAREFLVVGHGRKLTAEPSGLAG